MICLFSLYIFERSGESILNLNVDEVSLNKKPILDSCIKEWDGLLNRADSSCIFFSHWFLTSWHELFSPNRDLVICFIRKNNQLVGIIPILKGKSNLILAGDPELFDYQQFIIEKGMEAEVINAFFDYLSQKDWKRFELPSVSNNSQQIKNLMKIAEERSHSIKCEQSAVSPVLELPDSWDLYIASLRKKYRHELRRKIRRIESMGQVMNISISKPSEKDMDEFFNLMRLTSDAKSEFLTKKIEDFFRLLIRTASERNHMNLSFLEFNSKRVSGCLVFDYQNDFMLYNSGYDFSNRELSAGLINKAYTIKQAIELDRSRFNFLKGPERYKYELGGIDTPIYNISITRN